MSSVAAPSSIDKFIDELERYARICVGCGLNAIEPSIPDPWRIDIKDVARVAEEYGLRISAISTGLGFLWFKWSLSSRDSELRRKAVEALKKHIDNSIELDAPVIVGLLRGFGEEPLRDSLERFIEGLVECVEYAEDHGATLLLEPINRYETKLINTINEALEVIKRIGSKSLKLMVDTFHMNIEEPCIEASLVKAGEYIGYVHVADSNRLAPGYGHIDFKRVLSVLKELGYKGYLSLEIVPKPDYKKAVCAGSAYLRTIMKYIG